MIRVPFQFKLQPYAHQLAALEFIAERPHYALLMEQGTGKTAVAIWDFALRYLSGALNGVLVLAPNGVQTNWVRRELPAHWPEDTACAAEAWTSGAGKRESENIRALLQPNVDSFRILTMNWEALNTEEGYSAAFAFLRSLGAKGGILADESQRAKNPAAQRTKALFRLKALAPALRAIMSGTPILKSPWDAYSQFSWLDERILGTTSFWAFKAEYAELLPPGHGLLRHIAQRTRGKKPDPQIVAKDPITGLPRWRNLERLERLIAPHSFRVLKRDCLDLPEKVYTQRWFAMAAKQRAAYDRLKEELRLVLEDGTILPVERLGALTKLAQVASGYFLIPGTHTPQRLISLEVNPKIAVLMEALESCLEAGEQVIVWARFQAELRDIAERLAERRWAFVEYHGAIGSKTARQEAIDAFERGEAKIFLSQPAAGGVGLTLIAAASVAASMTVIYFSNTFNLEDRVQSEDRAHRIGQQKTVRYIDILAEDSIDEAIVVSLRAKKDIAAIVTGDARRAAEVLGLAR